MGFFWNGVKNGCALIRQAHKTLSVNKLKTLVYLRSSHTWNQMRLERFFMYKSGKYMGNWTKIGVSD